MVVEVTTGAVMTALGALGASGLFKRLVGPAADEVGQMLAEPFKAMRERRARNLAGKLEGAQKILDDRGYTGKDVRSPKLAVLAPTFEKASLVDTNEDPDLSAMWAGLIASEAIEEVPPAFPGVLADLSSEEARVLELVWTSMHRERRPLTPLMTDTLHGDVWHSADVMLLAGYQPAHARMLVPKSRDVLHLLKWHGLIEFVSVSDGNDVYNALVTVQPEAFALSPVGFALMQACHGPKVKNT